MELSRASAGEIAAAFAAGELSAREAVDAAIARIEQVNGALNAVVIPRFDEARAEADAADAARARGDALGALHGVPITIKECFDLAGTESTCGLPSRAGQPATADAPLVARLRAAGAIVVGKTNLSQALMFAESDNPVYGRANNPWDLERSPGGSSGGEAAILAAGGSALGLGTDIGGSVRQPAHSCGVCALLPTAHRLTGVGANELQRQEAIVSQPGSLARRVADLDLAMRVLVAPGPDPTVPPVPWTPLPAGEPDVRGLRIGWYDRDGFNVPAPAIRRAVAEAVDHLRDAGAELVELQVPNIYEAMALYVALFSADGGIGIARLLRGGEKDGRVAGLPRFGRLPAWLRESLGTISEMLGQTHLAHLCQNVGRRNVDEYWGLLAERARYRDEALAAFAVDAIVCPPSHIPARVHGSTGRLGPVESYAMLFNLLGMPAGVVPATLIRAGEESDRGEGGDLSDKAAYACEQGSAGLPVGVQVAAPPWREDVVLRVMAALENRFDPLPPPRYTS